MKTTDYSLETILDHLGIKSLNEMQEAALAANNQTGDVVLLSVTGSGKTLAFLLPLISRIHPEDRETQALIVAPSRELAQQIETVFKSMKTGIKVTCCYGGHDREVEERSLKQGPTVVIGTPGRLADHIRRGTLSTRTISCFVLDEFDKSLELGFEDEMVEIIEALPSIKKRMLTSATESITIPSFVGLRMPQKLNFLTQGSELSGDLSIKTVLSPGKDKLETLFQLLCSLGETSSIVFCNHRESVERTGKFLLEKGLFNDCYHGAMEQKDRDSSMFKFRNGSVRVLIATDLASRGLDIPHVQNIIHYHLPLTGDVFTHRNGRTARMDASGTGFVILSPEEQLPTYILSERLSGQVELPAKVVLPRKPEWVTLYVAAGKKDKINKVDIVGFLSNKGQLQKEDIGLIEVRDFFSFVAIKQASLVQVLQQIKGEKMKNKKILIEIAD